MAQSRFYSSTAQPTVLTAGITPSGTLIQVQQTVGFPVNTPYILAIDYNTPLEEIVLVTAVAGTSLTVTRAYDGTSGASHNAGAAVRHTWTAMDGNDSRAHEGSTANVHGVTGNLVGETQTQTLTNKTLPSPTITGTVGGSATYSTPTITSPSITGTVGGSASYTSPTLTGTVGGSATYTSPTLKDAAVTNSAIGVIPETINSIAGTTADLFKVQNNGTDRVRIPASGNLITFPSSGATSMYFGNAASGFTGTLADWQVNGASKFTMDASGIITQMGSTTITPTWTSTGTAPSVGNGSLTGEYWKFGKLVVLTITLTLGSTSTLGTGTYSFGIGAAPTAAITGQTGNSFLFKVSGANVILNSYFSATNTLRLDTTGGVDFGQTNWGTQSTLDNLNICITYKSS